MSVTHLANCPAGGNFACTCGAECIGEAFTQTVAVRLNELASVQGSLGNTDLAQVLYDAAERIEELEAEIVSIKACES